MGRYNFFPGLLFDFLLYSRIPAHVPMVIKLVFICANLLLTVVSFCRHTHPVTAVISLWLFVAMLPVDSQTSCCSHTVSSVAVHRLLQ